MTASVKALWRTYVKGAAGEIRPELYVDPIIGVIDDRRQAIRRKGVGKLDAWAPKAAFYVCMNEPRMAREKLMAFENSFESHEQTIRLKTEFGINGPLVVQAAGSDFSLHDTKGGYVSFVNMESVRALSVYAKYGFSPKRFRMNVWLTGLEPFEELTWVDRYPGTREILVGDCRFRVDNACERCKAIEANPLTGGYDQPVRDTLEKMMQERGYKSPQRKTSLVMGILAAPLHPGVIKKGDPVRLA
jgi:uncharacterized protein YcbX